MLRFDQGKLSMPGMIATNGFLLFYAGTSKEDIFLTTVYGLYFSHHYTHKIDLQALTLARPTVTTRPVVIRYVCV